jgi:hypothetical protein
MGISNARVGPGFQLKVSDATLSVFTAVAEVHNIKGPKITTKMISVFNQTSPSKFDEMRPSKLDLGQVTIDINYIPTEVTHNAIAGLIYLQLNGFKRAFQITNPVDAVVWSWQGYVSGFEPTWPEEDKLTAAVTIDPDGPPTIA